MRLLFDENLSPRLVQQLAAEFPDSTHVDSAGLRGARDEVVWGYARAHGLTIVSKDNDFRQIAFLQGPPPKIVWLSVGNEGTEAIVQALRRHKARIQTFCADPEESLLVLVAEDEPI
ncbi:MAG: DUF5615 family PIN-like protein [Nitrospirae bacterium]|nr:DUF5615 family PIN-like protein [Nitrospirota bacterium]